MQNNSIEVEFTAKFKRNIKILAKRYRRIRSDIQPIIEQLQSGKLPGDRVSGVGYTIFKLRVKNSDISQGKSGGYRIIYYLKTKTTIILITIYSKSDREDISADEIKEIVNEYDSNME
ncbi:MAG: type II toxin-antitoxin system RelE/ParE family toxin [Xenococcus sp. MO_188.B8]|nr:type II toxin-antitoxin system RelE/ParE family toxin [Xenococcus sp. MO_188.B8]